MVYVDKPFVMESRDQQARRAGARGGHIWSHMWADTLDELHAMAARVGMKKEWFQDHRVLPHYDLVTTKRALAIKLGAVEANLAWPFKEESMIYVVTTIQKPTPQMRSLLARVKKDGDELVVVGDAAGPSSYLKGAEFWSLNDQKKLPLKIAQILPEKNYSRKNIGYLLAMQRNPEVIWETDDDNEPHLHFERRIAPLIEAHPVIPRDSDCNWVNPYHRACGNFDVWPRGLPLQFAKRTTVVSPKTRFSRVLIQQDLVHGDPDVDAIYRLLNPGDLYFGNFDPMVVPPGVWCPFNSQNTRFFKAAFPLMYLPSYCSMRVTDIWRSLVAQRCLWQIDANLGFFSATMIQKRNKHDLLKDFKDEIPCYLENENIRKALAKMVLPNIESVAGLCGIMRRCYGVMVDGGWLPKKELELVEAWNKDVIGIIE